MKRRYFLLITLMVWFGHLYPQTAVNFTCEDCSGVTYDLFSELDAGKVVVLCWVMPCVSCIAPALTTHNVVQSFEPAYPGKVVLYVVDDYANTTCASLKAWSLNYGITEAVFFSNNSIKMSDYGSDGMPKIVVLGGPERRVFYNRNNTVSAPALQDSIQSAISATLTAITDFQSGISQVEVYPNPGRRSTHLKLQLHHPSSLSVSISDAQGQVLLSEYYPALAAGPLTLPLPLAGLSSGLYFIRVDDGVHVHSVKYVLQ